MQAAAVAADIIRKAHGHAANIGRRNGGQRRAVFGWFTKSVDALDLIAAWPAVVADGLTKGGCRPDSDPD